jgi:hypothetical protein
MWAKTDPDRVGIGELSALFHRYVVAGFSPRLVTLNGISRGPNAG